LAHGGGVYISNEARCQNIVIEGNFSLNNIIAKVFFTFLESMMTKVPPIFSNIKNFKNSVHNATGIFVAENYINSENHMSSE